MFRIRMVAATWLLSCCRILVQHVSMLLAGAIGIAGVVAVVYCHYTLPPVYTYPLEAILITILLLGLWCFQAP